MCAIKLDMHKVYDHVKWPFLKEFVLRVGFRENWVILILNMQYVSSLKYRVRFNAEEINNFKPSKELRHGPSLSLLVLIMYAGPNCYLSKCDFRHKD